jgi:hypothetical protein
MTRALANCGFDPQAYVAASGDLQANCRDQETAIAHFLRYGIQELRTVPAGAPGQGLAELLALAVDNRPYMHRLAARLLNAQLEHRQYRDTDPPAELWHALRDIPGLRFFAVAGDSHSRMYGWAVPVATGVLVPLHTLCPGGSALGLGRGHAKSRYADRVLDNLAALRAEMKGPLPVFMKFGQVDVEFVSVFRRVRSGQVAFDLPTFDAFVSEVLDSYRLFLERVSAHMPANLLRVFGIFPPTLSDEAWAQGYVNAQIGFLESDAALEEQSRLIRALEQVSHRGRIELHALFNSRLQAVVQEDGLAFVDDFHPFLDEKRRLAPAYRTHGGDDHHVGRSVATRIVTDGLVRQALKPRPQPA